MGEYTEEDDVLVGEPMLERNIPTWHALEALDFGYEINNKSDAQDEGEEDEISTVPN